MRTPEERVDDIIRLHTDTPEALEWQMCRKLMIVAVKETLMDIEQEQSRNEGPADQ